jgi:hypothetical protein
MPIVSGGGGGGGSFNGGTVTGQVVLAEANKDAVPLKITPAAGATADYTNQIEVYDDTGNLGFFVDAAAGLQLLMRAADNNSCAVSVDGKAILYVAPDSHIQLGNRLATHGYPVFAGPVTVPADADLSAYGFILWLDATPGATKLMVKAKDSGGTVRTAAIALS